MSSATSVIESAPANASIIALNSVLWFYCWNKRVEIERIAFNYDRVVTHGEWWRLVSSIFSHLDFMHILFNMSSLAGVAPLEESMGSLAYLKVTYLLMVITSTAQLLATYILVTRLGRETERHVNCVGYSGILFGWLVLQAAVAPAGSTVQMFGLLSMPAWASPLAALLITHLIVPNASWIGHISGIVAGFCVAVGLFSWFSNVLFYITLSWTVIFLLRSLKRTVPTSMPCVEIQVIGFVDASHDTGSQADSAASSRSSSPSRRGGRGQPLGVAPVGSERPRLVNGVVRRSSGDAEKTPIAASNLSSSSVSSSHSIIASAGSAVVSSSSAASLEMGIRESSGSKEPAADPSLPSAHDEGEGVGFTYG